MGAQLTPFVRNLFGSARRRKGASYGRAFPSWVARGLKYGRAHQGERSRGARISTPKGKHFGLQNSFADKAGSLFCRNSALDAVGPKDKRGFDYMT